MKKESENDINREKRAREAEVGVWGKKGRRKERLETTRKGKMKVYADKMNYKYL